MIQIIIYSKKLYYYIKNTQEDIIGITDSNYNLLCSYEYDSWGKPISIKDNNGNIITSTSHIGYINPFRYRSYYYDNETKLYYLNSRYYNPEWGRFISADIYLDTEQDVNSSNMYAYTGNNPTSRIDVEGEFWLPVISAVVGGAISVVANGISNIANGEDFFDGWFSSALGGAFSGALLTLPVGNTFAGSIISNYGSALIENSFTSNSLSELAYNTVAEGTNNLISGKIADKIMPATTVGRKPNSFKTTIKSKRIKNSTKNNITSTTISIAKDIGKLCKQGASYIKKTYNSVKKKVKSFFKKLFS